MDTYNPALFLDVKLALLKLILKKLPTYDIDRDMKFLTYIHQFIYDAFKTFRMQQECWKIDSLDIYKGIRRIYSNQKGKSSSPNGEPLSLSWASIREVSS